VIRDSPGEGGKSWWKDRRVIEQGAEQSSFGWAIGPNADGLVGR
jgi:hypothetical protein